MCFYHFAHASKNQNLTLPSLSSSPHGAPLAPDLAPSAGSRSRSLHRSAAGPPPAIRRQLPPLPPLPAQDSHRRPAVGFLRSHRRLPSLPPPAPSAPAQVHWPALGLCVDAHLGQDRAVGLGLPRLPHCLQTRSDDDNTEPVANNPLDVLVIPNDVEDDIADACMVVNDGGPLANDWKRNNKSKSELGRKKARNDAEASTSSPENPTATRSSAMESPSGAHPSSTPTKLAFPRKKMACRKKLTPKKKIE
ncbi:hypothetical protein GUJ93_ZPchr0002g23003 [Zizania palustris]|uniref:Uncharacterized protein n=1 Tax=Zizania palustris TaxID=103762 RepID=A0A8J5S4P4_ZIZPA|nr:hypothetical protein GUJ93_ZPchr0002g23003 [Zizania palustris]